MSTPTNNPRVFHPDIASYAARWGEQAWRIALCLHAAAWVEEAGQHSLGEETARAALRIAEWFARQQMEILEEGREAGQRSLQERLLTFLIGKPRGLTVREFQRGGPLRGMSAAAAMQVLSGMEAAGQVMGEEHTPANGGHPVRRYRLKACGQK